VILNLPFDEARNELGKHYSTSIDKLFPGANISNWKVFCEAKYEAAQMLKKRLISNDYLRLYCFIRVFARSIYLLIWYAIIIMYADISSGGAIFCQQSACQINFVECAVPLFIDYLHITFTLFLSVSSISLLTSTIPGTIIVLGQIIVYFSILIVIVGRITENLSMCNSQIDDIAHQCMVEKCDCTLTGGLVS